MAYDTVASHIAPYGAAAASQVAALDTEVLGLLHHATGIPYHRNRGTPVPQNALAQSQTERTGPQDQKRGSYRASGRQTGSSGRPEPPPAATPPAPRPGPELGELGLRRAGLIDWAIAPAVGRGYTSAACASRPWPESFTLGSVCGLGHGIYCANQSSMGCGRRWNSR